MSTTLTPERLDADALRRWPLPALDHDADKAQAGQRLAERAAAMGFLARELPQEMTAALGALDR